MSLCLCGGLFAGAKILRSSTSQRGMDPSPRPFAGEGGERSEPGEGPAISKRSWNLGPQIPGPGRARDQNHPFNHRDAEAPTLKRNGVLRVSVPLWWAVRGSELSGCEPMGCERHLHHHSDVRPSVATNDWCLISRPPIRNWHSNFPARQSAIVNHKSAIQRPCHSTGRVSSWWATGLGTFGFQ